MEQMYALLSRVIEQNDTFTLLTHNNPDGDAIASMFAMKRYLEKRNKIVHIALHNPIPENYRFWLDKYVGKIDIPNNKSDCLIVLDTPTPEKTYEGYKDLGDYIVVIDHHKNTLKYGDLNVTKITTCTGVLLWEFFNSENFSIDKQIAEFLFMSLCWDTEGFKNSFATEYIYCIAANLISKGAVPQRVFRYLFEYKKKSDLKVQKMFFNQIVDTGRIKYLALNGEDLALVDNSDIYNFLGYIKSLENLELFIIFIDRGSFLEIKINNNQNVYIYLKNTYKRLYRIEIDVSFEVDVNRILEELKNIMKIR